MYGSHDMRHTGFSHVDGGQRDLQELGRHNLYGIWFDVLCKPFHVHRREVVLVGDFFYWALLTPLWDPISSTRGV